MSLKLKCHKKWNITITEMSLILKMSLKLKCYKTEMSLEMKCH